MLARQSSVFVCATRDMRRDVLVAALIGATTVGLALPHGLYDLSAQDAVAAPVWWLVAVTGILGWRIARLPRPLVAAAAFLGALAAWTAVSMRWASDDARAF